MAQVSTIDTAYSILEKSKKALPFDKLWEKVLLNTSIDEKQVKSKKVKLYSAMMLDPRFASLKDNTWDLTEHVSYEQKHIDTSELELSDDDDTEFNNEDLLDEGLSDDFDKPDTADDNEDDY